MPYESIDAAKKAGFPTSADDIDLTLAQINKLAEIHDAIKKAGNAENPMAVAWTQWKALHTKAAGAWIVQSSTQAVPEGMEAATLSFGSVDKILEDANGDTIFKDVTLLAEGTWTDGHSRIPTHYSGGELEKMHFEKVTMKMDHDIFGALPLTNEIGIIENPRFVRDTIAKWLGDVRIFPTQNGRDTATLLKRGKITDISSELFLKPVLNSKTKVAMATDMVFMGAATVRQGACTVCKFNEGIDNMTEETPETATGGNEPEGVVGTPGLAELEAGINEQTAKSTEQTTAELNLAQGRIVELEATNKELKTKVAMLENDTTTKIKELTRKLDTLSKQPVIHTVMAGAPGTMAPMAAQPVELDSGGYEAFSASDFTED